MTPPTDARAPTVGSVLRQAEQCLRTAEIEAPRVQASSLLGHVLGLERAQLLARLSDSVPARVAEQLDTLVARRAAHEPLQYLLGRASFLDFEVQVGPGVFIPRPETEQLVEQALAVWAVDSSLAIDLCSGSGAITIALARARPTAHIIGIEVSPVAIASARLCAEDTGVGDRVSFVRADLLAALRPDTALAQLGLLVCNPPYAASGDIVQPEVRDHEPREAWEASPSGVEVYRRLIPQAAALLPRGCPLVLELGYGQEVRVPGLLRADGNWDAAQIDPDFQDIPRVLTTHRA